MHLKIKFGRCPVRRRRVRGDLGLRGVFGRVLVQGLLVASAVIRRPSRILDQQCDAQLLLGQGGQLLDDPLPFSAARVGQADLQVPRADQHALQSTDRLGPRNLMLGHFLEHVLGSDHMRDKGHTVATDAIRVDGALQRLGQPLHAWIVQRTSAPRQEKSILDREIVAVPAENLSLGIIRRQPVLDVVFQMDVLAGLPGQRHHHHHQNQDPQ